jgi:small subunit ribosomal protein S3
LHTSKPGIVIGKQGANVEKLRQNIEKTVGKKVNVKIEEIKIPETDAKLIAESISEQIQRRVAYRRAMKHAVQQAMRRGAKGVKIRLAGRLGGAEMRRQVTEKDGRVPLHTIRANIDYAVVHARTTYGRIGVKVWVYKGDILPQRGDVTDATLTADLANAGD